MIVRYLLVSILLGCALLLLSESCGIRRETGVVTRITVGDTLVVTTVPPSEPPSQVFTLEHDLTLGVEEGEDPYVLTGFGSVAEDDEGRIYLSNQRDGEIRIFDASGSFVTRFGRRGGGPGEFNSNSWGPFDVTPVDGDRLTVEDIPSLRVFDRSGNYQHSFDLSLLVTRIEVPGHATYGIRWYPGLGKLVTVWRESGPVEERSIRLLVIDEELTTPKLLPPVMEPNGLYMEDQRGVSIPFVPSFHWTVTGRHTLVWGLSDRYRLNLYNMAEDKWISAVIDCDPEPVTREDIEAFKESFLRMGSRESNQLFEPLLNRIPYPSYKPFFNELLGDNLGRVWVLRSMTSWEADEVDIYVYDLFDNTGEWLGYVESSGLLLHVLGDHVYMRGKEDYPTLERFKLVPN